MGLEWVPVGLVVQQGRLQLDQDLQDQKPQQQHLSSCWLRRDARPGAQTLEDVTDVDWDNVTNWTDSILALKVRLANMNRLFKRGFISIQIDSAPSAQFNGVSFQQT